MSGSGNVWDAFRDVLRLQEKVERLDTRVVSQQANVERVNMDVAVEDDRDDSPQPSRSHTAAQTPV